MKRWRPVFDHLLALTDERGLFEHALHMSPRAEHGYCVDDVARALVVTCREPEPDVQVRRLQRCYLDFVLDALEVDGTCHNRMTVDGNWADDATLEDWWGRAVWALGTATALLDNPGLQARALTGFRIAAQQRSPHGRAMAFAALGSAAVLRARPSEISARELLRDTVAVVDPDHRTRPTSHLAAMPSVRATGTVRDWPWPEDRLRYANGAVAEALLVAGEALKDKRLAARGIELLMFLMRIETGRGQLSVTPACGRGPADDGPGFDQQPIEVATIADACATAYRITGDPRWLNGISLAWRWFLGDNDSGVLMFDEVSGAGYDGLEIAGRNLNCGAESTLAMLSTAQHARRVQALR